MPTTTTETTRTGGSSGNWRAGVVGGIAGALAMGGLVLAMNAPTLAVAIPSLYTLAPPPNPGIGMAVHASHGAILGAFFAGIVGVLNVETPTKTVALGIGWGVVIWIGLAALLMPVWLGAVGSPASPPSPNFAVPSLLWHVVYGGVLAVIYVAIEDAI